MEGWLHKETDRPRSSGVGRFGRLTEKVREQVLQAIQVMSLSETFVMDEGLNVADVISLAGELQYEIPSVELDDNIRRRLISQHQQLVAQSAFKGHFYMVRKRPVTIQ